MVSLLGDARQQMNSKHITNSRSSNGTRGRKSPPAARSPLSAAWRSSAAALISKSDAPSAGGSAAETKARTEAVFLIQDSRPRRDSLTAMLGVQGFNVVATARSGGEALRHVARLEPQLVLLNSMLGNRDSLRLVEAVKKMSPNTKVIVMHLPPGQEDVVALVRAGVSGFILKDASIAECVATIQSVADGASVLPPIMTGTLFSHVAAQVQTRKRVKAVLRIET